MTTLMLLDFFLTATGTGVSGYELPLLHVKPAFGVHRPLMMTMATQGIAFMLLLKRGNVKGNNFSHKYRS